MIQTVARKKDIYRPAFCSSQFYQNHLHQFSLIHHHIQHLELFKQITVWILACSCLRRPQTWYAGNRTTALFSESSRDFTPFLLYQLFIELSLSWPSQLSPTITLEEFCATVRIAPLPLSALNGLYHFYSGSYQLQILNYEPQPLELLQLQMTGKRVLTFENDFKKWPTLKYGERDVLSFWLHDLIHAEHFLSHPQNHRGQIGFYRLVYEIICHKILDPILLNPEFNAAFCYLISDMNSHPVHLIKTLKAHIQIHEKSHFGEIYQKNLWERVINMPVIYSNKNIYDIFSRLNTCNFVDSDALKLTSFFELDLYQLTLS